MPKIEVENPFVAGVPSAQNAVDIFKGEWASGFPAAKHIAAGTVPLFEDPRVGWADRALTELCGMGFKDQDVLELGPLEAGHTYMLGALGARSVTAVEANARAYMKCLIAKEVLRIDRASFLLGDAIEYLKSTDRVFDVGVAVAFLNHQVQPVQVIQLLAERCRKVFLWNVVYDEALFTLQPELASRFGAPQQAVCSGFTHTLHPHYYAEGFDVRTFWGGAKPSCCWMRGAEVVGALRHFGFDRVTSHEEENPFGKAVCAVGVKQGG